MKQQDHSQDYSAIIADDGRQSLHPIFALAIAMSLVVGGNKNEAPKPPPKKNEVCELHAFSRVCK